MTEPTAAARAKRAADAVLAVAVDAADELITVKTAPASRRRGPAPAGHRRIDRLGVLR